MGRGHLLAGKGLEILDGMFGGIDKEFTQDADGFIVGDVDVGLLTKRFAMDILEVEDQGQCQSQGP